MRQEREGNQDNRLESLTGFEFDVWVVEDQGEVVRVKLTEADAKNFLTGYGSRTAAVIQTRAVLPSGVYTSQEQKRS